MIFTFDPPETGWSMNAQCSIIANPSAPSQPNSLHVIFGSLTAACFRTLSGLTVGESYGVWVRVNFDGDSVGSARLRIEYNDSPGYFSATMVKPYDESIGEVVNSGWEVRYLGQLHYLIADRVLRINGLPLVGSLATVELDAIYIGEAPPSPPTPEDVAIMAGKWAAIDAALGVVRAINGSIDSYNTNLDGRAYSRLILPGEDAAIKKPYACIPLDQEGESLTYEGFGVTSSWRLTGYAFFDDNPESDKLNSAGGELAAKFRDDLVRAFMLDQHLSGTTQNCEVTSIDTAAGSDADPYTWVVFTIEFTQMVGTADLAV